MYDVTRAALLDALYRYPTPGPDKFFPWLQATIAHGALDHLKAELPELRTPSHSTAEAEALQRALHGLEDLGTPHVRDAPNRANWRNQIPMRDLFDVADSYFTHGAVQRVCRLAVGRLAPKQRDVVDHLFFQGDTPEELANDRGVTKSTIYNHKSQALGNLRKDDEFFTGLCALGKVRDRARKEAIESRYPNGTLPDGRRIVVIEEDRLAA